MTTIIWKMTVPFGTCRSRYKSRRAATVAARQREKRLQRRMGYLLDQEGGVTLSQKMRSAFPSVSAVRGVAYPARVAACFAMQPISRDPADKNRPTMVTDFP